MSANSHTLNLNKNRVAFETFTGSHELLANIQRANASRRWSSDAWYDNEGPSEVTNLLEHGDQENAAAADLLLGEVSACSLAELETMSVRPDVVGASPSIGQYLSGSPMSMRRRVRRPREGMLRRVFVGLTCSAISSADLCRKRGIAALAISQALAARGPVELYAYASVGASGSNSLLALCELGLSPWNVSDALAVCAHAGTTRGLFYSLCDAIGVETRVGHFNGGWAVHSDAALLAATHGYSPLKDVLIPQQDMRVDSLIQADPAKYAREALMRALSGEGEGEGFEVRDVSTWGAQYH